MALSVEQLKSPPTRGQVTQWLISLLQTFGFQATGWQEGRIAHTMLNTFATGLSSLAQLGSTIVGTVFNDTSFGTALSSYSASRFSNTRLAAVATEGVFQLDSTATVPYSLEPGQLSIFDPSGLTFVSTTGGTLSAGGTLDVTVKCETVGAIGNIGNGATLQLSSPLAGVTVTNPSPGQDSEGNDLPWYTVTGRDQESDSELRIRNSTKWGLLAIEKTSTAVINLALKQDGVSKATGNFANPRGDYTVDVYVSAESSLISTAEITAAQEAFAKYTFNTEAVWPPTESPRPSAYYLKHPNTVELSVVGNVYYDPQYTEDEMNSRVQTAIDDFVAGIPIGGRSYVSGAENLVTLGDILEVIEGVRGVQAATLTSPTGNIQLAYNDLVTAPDSWTGASKLVLVAVDS